MTVEVVQLPNLPSPNWYARITYPDGRTYHGEPWKTAHAADYAAAIIRRGERWFLGGPKGCVRG